MLILRLDTAAMRDRLPHVRDLVGRRITSRAGPGAPFSTFLRSVWGEIRNRDGDWVDALGEVIWPMLTMACVDPGEAPPRARQHERERDAIRALIERQLDEPDLGPRMIAKEAGYSVRFVQLLFAEQGTTPTAYIRGRRLQRAADITRCRARSASRSPRWRSMSASTTSAPSAAISGDNSGWRHHATARRSGFKYPPVRPERSQGTLRNAPSRRARLRSTRTEL